MFLSGYYLETDSGDVKFIVNCLSCLSVCVLWKLRLMGVLSYSYHPQLLYCLFGVMC
jgi:hypothetical protein